MNETFAAAPATTTPNVNDLPRAHPPFALHAQKRVTDIEDEVVRLVTHRNGHSDAEIERDARDLYLGENALLIRRQHLLRRSSATNVCLFAL